MCNLRRTDCHYRLTHKSAVVSGVTVQNSQSREYNLSRLKNISDDCNDNGFFMTKV